ncbi:MAG TPA: NADH-ubiquinone oxidoreductase-F iron-sulfur binding region domain-containing protein [Candidatus Sulfotelmatobacter sp.]|nr:NADH-ubiquinone oxidoreductase-F iron-sulfur binding region domain-containing protein [Candidatus Sulfotelmatobacter sp.]
MKTTQAFLLPEKRVESLDAYIAGGGGEALNKALALPRDKIIAEVKKSGLRGRGGGGFPTGLKWAGVAHDPCPEKYLVCNGSEGEPGCFKDHMLIRKNPYQLLEGIAIAAYAIRATKAFLGIKASSQKEVNTVRRALDEMSKRNELGPTPIELVLGPEDYLFGEEKALLEVIEGRDPLPREADNPPYVDGLFITDPAEPNPTVVNNVETLSNIPHIVLRGAAWFRTIGTPDSPGTMIFTVCEDVQRPGVYELPMGTPLRSLVYDCAGGPLPGRQFKAFLSGVANPVILPSRVDTPMDFNSLRAIGSGLGSGGFIVYDGSACMVRVAHLFAKFLWLESCNQCSSCKVGTNQSMVYLEKLIGGNGDSADLEFVIEGAMMAPHGNRCYLPVEHSLSCPSIVGAFSKEFRAHYKRGCQDCRGPVLPKILDLDEAKHTFMYSPGRLTP